MRFVGRSAIVTGAASGLGQVTATRLAREGANVLIVDVLEEEGVATARGLEAAGFIAHFIRLDVCSANDWRAAIAWMGHNYGAPDILINNAGISGTGYEDPLGEYGWRKLLEVNATGAFLGAQAVIPAMKGQHRGSIVNISSISAFLGQQNVHVGYNASKAAVHLLTKSLAVQCGRDGIRCNSVHPGLMPPMRTTKPSPDPGARDRFMVRVPLGRAGTLDEIANPILFLASEDASYITGAEIYVDGGFLAG